MVRSFRMSFYRIMPFVKREFYFFLSNQDAFISLVLSFFCLSVLAWSFDALFDSNSKCEYCHILDLERKKHNKFFFSTFSVCLLCILHRSLRTCWRSSMSGLLSIAFIIYGYLSSTFSLFLTWLHYFYAFIYFLVVVVVGLFSVL